MIWRLEIIVQCGHSISAMSHAREKWGIFAKSVLLWMITFFMLTKTRSWEIFPFPWQPFFFCRHTVLALLHCVNRANESKFVVHCPSFVVNVAIISGPAARISYKCELLVSVVKRSNVLKSNAVSIFFLRFFTFSVNMIPQGSKY